MAFKKEHARGPGRPALPEGTRRRSVGISMDPAAITHMRATAEAFGMSQGEYIEMLMRGEIEEIPATSHRHTLLSGVAWNEVAQASVIVASPFEDPRPLGYRVWTMYENRYAFGLRVSESDVTLWSLGPVRSDPNLVPIGERVDLPAPLADMLFAAEKILTSGSAG
jgi:hypothetical protein